MWKRIIYHQVGKQREREGSGVHPVPLESELCRPERKVHFPEFRLLQNCVSVSLINTMGFAGGLGHEKRKKRAGEMSVFPLNVKVFSFLLSQNKGVQLASLCASLPISGELSSGWEILGEKLR